MSSSIVLKQKNSASDNHPPSCPLNSPYYRVDLVISGFKKGYCIIPGHVNSLFGCAVMSLLSTCFRSPAGNFRRYIVGSDDNSANYRPEIRNAIAAPPTDCLDMRAVAEIQPEASTNAADISQMQNQFSKPQQPTAQFLENEPATAHISSQSPQSTPTSSSATDPETGEQSKRAFQRWRRLRNMSTSSFPSEGSFLDTSDNLSARRLSEFYSEEQLMDSLFETSTLRSQASTKQFLLDVSWGSTQSLYPPSWEKHRRKTVAKQRVTSQGGAEPAEEQMYLDDSNDHEEDFYLGKLKISLAFNSAKKTLSIKIIQAKDLMPQEMDGAKPSSLVKFYILPGGTKYLAETALIHEKNHPTWNEVFILEGISRRRLKGRDLILKIMEKKLFGVGPYGVAKVPLTFLHYRLSRRSVSLWRYIRPDEEKVEGGKIQISLTLKCQRKMLVFGVHQAIDLKNTSITSIISPFVRILVKGNNDKTLFKKDTNIVPHSINPAWREYIEIPLVNEGIANLYLEVIVKDGGTRAMGHGNLVGRTKIGYGTRGDEMRHWQYVQKHTKTEIYMWHQLFPRLIS